MKKLDVFISVLVSIILIAAVVSGITLVVLNSKVYKGQFNVISGLSQSKNIFSFFKKPEKPKSIIYGYLPYWNIDKAEYLQLDKLTDIAYFGLYINADGTFVTRDADGNTEPGYNNWHNNEDLDKLIKDSKKNDVRFALTIISHTDEVSDKFLDCKECWTEFTKNLKKELDYHQIKDVNFNFEYVEYPAEDKQDKYVDFVTFVSKFLDKNYHQPFVVVSTFADSMVKTRISKIEPLGKIADALFIMAYDFHQPNSDNAGPVAPIDGKGVYAEYDVRTMLKDYLTVVPPSKIIMGIPYYGYNWLVESPEKYAKRRPGSDNIGRSQSQAYSDIMDTLLELKPEVKWDELARTPYFTYTSPESGQLREVYYEDVRSLEAKYDLVKENTLAGIGIWALGYDGGYQELWQLLQKYFIDSK